jgi:hypothetical protein
LVGVVEDIFGEGGRTGIEVEVEVEVAVGTGTGTEFGILWVGFEEENGVLDTA